MLRRKVRGSASDVEAERISATLRRQRIVEANPPRVTRGAVWGQVHLGRVVAAGAG